MQKVNRSFHTVIRTILTLKRPLKGIFTKISKRLEPIQTAFTHRLDAIAYRFRRSIAWMEVLCRYGAVKVQEVTETLFLAS